MSFESEKPPIAEGDEVSVSMTLEDLSVKLSAQVRWRVGSKFGLFFHKSVKNGEISPPSDLMNVVRKIERQYLQRISSLEE